MTDIRIIQICKYYLSPPHQYQGFTPRVLGEAENALWGEYLLSKYNLSDSVDVCIADCILASQLFIAASRVFEI